MEGFANTGNRNTGDLNAGNRNTGHQNTGYFNSTTPDIVNVFNQPCSRCVWDKAVKPKFIFAVQSAYWVGFSEMTDAEKAADRDAQMRGGQLRSRTYAEAWRKAWDETTDADRRLVLTLPNFDADVFLEITGIDVRKELA